VISDAESLDCSLYSILFAPPPERIEDLTADLSESGTAGIIEGAQYLRAFFEETYDPDKLVRKYEIMEMRREPDTKNFEFAREDWEPIYVGEKFLVAPSWLNETTPPGRFRLTAENSRAFGTGRHETTQLMLRAMEQHLAPGMTVLDVGAGSGILSVAAAHLRARRVFSCDIHLDSVLEAAHVPGLSVFAGSADAVKSNLADLVLVNISAKIIDAIAGDLKRVAKASGALLLSGFFAERVPSCWKPEAILEQDGWQCWVCRPDAIVAAGDEERGAKIHTEQWW
jgi:ribosomal protein L11 methylase PrmA